MHRTTPSTGDGRGSADPAFPTEPIHRLLDCLTVAKSVLPSLPIFTGSWRDSLKLPAGGFSRRLRLDGERMDGALKFRCKRRIYHAVALDPALPFEGRRHDIDPEMRLAARPVTRMALMQMRFVRDVEAFRQESFTQLV